MSIVESVTSVFTKYVDFSGRARRSEYWWWVLVYSVVGGVLSGLANSTGSTAIAVISVIVFLACLLPNLAVSARRLHDIGRSGWWLLLELTCVGAIVILIWACMDSQPGDNQYGPNPKGM